MEPKKESQRNEANPIRVLIIDDNKVIRDTLTSLLENTLDIEMVAQAGNGGDGIELAKKLLPDVIITDINMLWLFDEFLKATITCIKLPPS